jgi:hypothetical protein
VRFGIIVEVSNPPRVEGGATPNDAVHLVAFLQQQLCQVGAVLARDTGDKRYTTLIAAARRRPAVAAGCHSRDSAMLEDIFHD